MSIDSRIRDAVDETLRVPVDVDHGLAALRRTHRQRRTTRIGAGVAVVALVVAGVLVRHHDSRPEPTPTPGPVPCGSAAAISGSPFANTGTHAFAPPGGNAAGDGDWVLLLQTQ